MTDDVIVIIAVIAGLLAAGNTFRLMSAKSYWLRKAGRKTKRRA